MSQLSCGRVAFSTPVSPLMSDLAITSHSQPAVDSSGQPPWPKATGEATIFVGDNDGRLNYVLGAGEQGMRGTNGSSDGEAATLRHEIGKFGLQGYQRRNWFAHVPDISVAWSRLGDGIRTIAHEQSRNLVE